MNPVLNYVPREIHALMGQTSHNMIAHMAEIRDQEKLRADPRFAYMIRNKQALRYQKIFKGTPYLPIFYNPANN